MKEKHLLSVSIAVFIISLYLLKPWDVTIDEKERFFIYILIAVFLVLPVFIVLLTIVINHLSRLKKENIKTDYGEVILEWEVKGSEIIENTPTRLIVLVTLIGFAIIFFRIWLGEKDMESILRVFGFFVLIASIIAIIATGILHFYKEKFVITKKGIKKGGVFKEWGEFSEYVLEKNATTFIIYYKGVSMFRAWLRGGPAHQSMTVYAFNNFDEVRKIITNHLPEKR